MCRTVLVPLDGSPLAEHALTLAIVIAKKAQAGIRLAVVHSTDFRGPRFDVEASRAERTYLDQIAARVREASGLGVTADVVEEGPVALWLCGYAAAVQADLIVLTTHGRGPASRFWLGSVADELLRTATIPVLVHRPPADTPPDFNAEFRPRHLLVPLDGSPMAASAVAPASELARLFGAGLRLLRVVEPIPFMETVETDALLEQLATRAGADLVRVADELRSQTKNVETKVVVNRHAAEAILAAAEHADLVVMGSHGRGRMGRMLLGSVTDKVVRGSSRPVLVVRSPSSPGGDS